MKAEPKKAVRCAIYTRKSSEEGLEQDFNSLHAQREACESFIASQRGEGWGCIATAYDDGGYSGGNIQRPALARLMDDIERKLVDVIVVYKVDRLTRSLADFAKLVELFDSHSVSFVSVTQQFNTTSSMGRLTLNVLLSFAQFEREVTGERIRDKIAASKKKGMWMGGRVPLGYDAYERKLIPNATEAKIVNQIFRLYLQLGSVRLLSEELLRRKIQSRQKSAGRSGVNFSRGALYDLLSNPLYIGQVRHKDMIYVGQHHGIVSRELWDAAQAMLQKVQMRKRGNGRSTEPSPLIGKLFDQSGQRLTPMHTKKGSRRYRYYVSLRLRDGGVDPEGWRLPASEIEKLLISQARALMNEPAEIVRAAGEAGVAIPDARLAIRKLEAGRQAESVVLSLVERVDLSKDGIILKLAVPVGKSMLKFVRRSPIRIQSRGVEKRLVIHGKGVEPRAVDRPLLKAVARAHRWFGWLEHGQAKSIKDIAIREGLVPNYVGRILPLAFLAPPIVESILDGTQHPRLTLKALMTDLKLSSDWTEQLAAVKAL